MNGYEVRYAIFHDRADGTAYWLRETHNARTGPMRWLVRSRPGEAPLVRFGPASAGPGDGPFTGRLDDVDWDVSWTPGRRGWPMVPWTLRALGSPRVQTLAPAARFGGRVADREIRDAHGIVARIHGRRYSRPWAWAFACLWDPPMILEALGSGRMLSLTAVAPAWRVRRNWIGALPGNRVLVPAGPHGWTAGATGFDRQIRLVVKSEPDRFVELEYEGPGGERLRCCNTLHADAEFQIRSRLGFGTPWGHWRTHVARGTMAFEYAQPG